MEAVRSGTQSLNCPEATLLADMETILNRLERGVFFLSSTEEGRCDSVPRKYGRIMSRTKEKIPLLIIKN